LPVIVSNRWGFPAYIDATLAATTESGSAVFQVLKANAKREWSSD